MSAYTYPEDRGLVGALLTPVITLAALALVSFVLYNPRVLSTHKSVAIIVLGDIGRSPRMLYHAQSFLSHGYITHIVAYRGSTPPKELVDAPNVRFVYLPQPLGWVSKLPKPLFLLFAPAKVFLNAVMLFWTLVWKIEVTPSFFLVQNPPAIPTLPIVQCTAALRGTRIIIDWHNTGYSVLALRLGIDNPVVLVAKWIESLFGRKAYAHLCVADAMKDQLNQEVKLQGKKVVFHDRPPRHFRRQTDSERQSLFSRLPFLSSSSLSSFQPSSLSSRPTSNSSKSPKTALVVSATSWTADEDFTVLLSALNLYEAAAQSASVDPNEGRRLPKILMVITGQGAGKEGFEKFVQILEKRWEWVRVRTAWLEMEDYPKLLGSADLGISMHASTSGADLPMKVVDMFGCGLPVCALDFACVSELVKDGVNGRVFKTAEDLADQLITLLRSPTELEGLREGIQEARYGVDAEKWGPWDESWDKVVLPLLTLQE